MSFVCSAELVLTKITLEALTYLVPNAYGSRTFGPRQLAPIDWSPWTNSPPGQTVPKNLVPMDKWSPIILVHLDKWSLEYSICPGVQAEWIRKYGDQIGWGPFVQGDQFYEDCLSRGTGSGGPEWGSNGFGTKWFAAPWP